MILVECKEAVADVFFLLDESSSIGTNEAFKKELNFVTSVIDYLEIGPTKSQVGVMTFSDEPKIKFYLNDYKTREDVAEAVNQIEWGGGNTFLDRALKLLRQHGLNSAYGSRASDGVPQIAVVITDGVSTDPASTKAELRKTHAQKYIMFAIGMYLKNIYCLY